MKSSIQKDIIKKLIPVLSEKEKQEISAYYTVYEKYEEELTKRATEDLIDHPVFGKLLRDIPKEVAEARNKFSRELQKDAIRNDNWLPYIEYQIEQGITYARMEFDFKSWYELIALVRIYMTPFLQKEYGRSTKLLSALNGMNCFMDISMGIIGEAYLQEKNRIIKQANERLSSIFETTADMIFVLEVEKNETYRFSSVNKAFQTTTGIPYDMAVGKYVNEIIPRLSLNIALEKYKIAIEEKKITQWEETSQYSTGLFTGEVSITPLFDEEENCIRLVCTIHDITERKQAEKALKESEERFRSLYENSTIGIYRTTPDGKILLANPALMKLLGYSSFEDISIRNLEEEGFESSIERSHFMDIMKREGEVKGLESAWKRMDGTTLLVSENARAIHDKAGSIIYYDGTVEDITEKKQIQNELLKHRDHLEELVNERTEELRVAKKEAENANMAKSEFLANMSHEIRTPMNAVLGYTELLSSMLVDQTQKDYINSIKSSGRSLLTLINDILDLSKIEAGKLELEYDYVDTCTFFSEFEMIFSLKIAEKKLKFILDITSGTPARICIDEARVRQIVFNLIGNAIKFTSEGKIILKVFSDTPQVVYYSKDKSEEFIDLIIEVKDTGIGISKEFQEAIFEPFVQEREFKHYGGTGLGLAITRRLMALMNGTITVQSEHGKGSTFIIRIPEISYMRDFSKITAGIHIDPLEIVFEQAEILIVDDVEHNRSYLRDALKNTNLKIVEAGDGITGYKLAKEIVPDLIIADIRMPKMDGFQLLNKIKTDKKLKHVPVIAYSASVLKAQKERIHNSDFAGLLMKPVKVTELYLALMNILPYKSTSETKHDKPQFEVDFISEISDLPGLIQSLETGFFATWQTFAITQPISGIRDFGSNLVQLGTDHNSSIIKDYGKELISAADSYNIESILKLVGKFSGIIETLKV